MSDNRHGSRTSGGLRLRVYVDAALLSPRRFAIALWWRILGKRVRARGQFAVLLAKSRYAYEVWMSREVLPSGLQTGPQLVALVPPGAEDADMRRSLEAQGVLIVADVESAPGDSWVIPLEAGDRLAAGAAAIYRAYASGSDGDIIYADDDLLDSKGRRTAPHFKPKWNSELFRHHDFISGACMLRAAAIGNVRGSDPATLVRAALAVSSAPPQHIPHVLHHRRRRPMAVIPTTSDPATSTALPSVSVIIPTRNRLELLRTCIDGLVRTAYPDLEIIVVDNGSDDPETLAWLDEWSVRDRKRHRVLRAPGPFNYSSLNNRAARQATGTLLCLLNNDVEVLQADWLAIMARQAVRDGVGAVGARLLYPDGRIQHAGVVLGVGNAAGHAHRLVWPKDEGYHHRHSLPHFVSAVTAACLVVRRDHFEAVGGLDEQNFAVAFNDVDLCLRLNARGWQSLYEPRATLVHHESVSRGFDRDPVGAARFAGELAALQRLWSTTSLVDPSHHPQLSRASEQFVVST